MLTIWWRQPNAWCAMGTTLFLSGAIMLDVGRFAGAQQSTELQRVETFKPVISTADTEESPVEELLRIHEERAEANRLEARQRALKQLLDERTRHNAGNTGTDAKPEGSD